MAMSAQSQAAGAASQALSRSVMWQQMLKTSLLRNKKKPYAKYLQVATVRPDGKPANRTVVFRGFLWDTEKLTFVTDTRSNKVTDVETNPFCEVAWYFPDSREQYRIQGSLSIIQAGHEDEKLARARTSAWKNMSDPGRTQFEWPKPGLPRPEPEDKSEFDIPAPASEEPPSDNFSLVILDPSEVDYLSLKENKRMVFKRSDADDGVSLWSNDHVNP